MKKLNICLAATGISSKACDIYLNKISRSLRKRGHRVWLIRVNSERKHKDDISIYWQGPRWRLFWVFYLLCPYLQDKSISCLVNKAINRIKEPVDVINFEVPFLAYCYRKKKKEKIIVRGWFYPHNLWQRLKIMLGITPKYLLFIIRQFFYYWGDNFGFKKADSIITLTPKLARQLKKLKFRATWIPLGCKVGKYQKRAIKKSVTFGAVAYDLENPRKGIRFLLEAVKQLALHHPRGSQMDSPKVSSDGEETYRLELIGRYTSKLQKQINALGLSKKIILLGKLNHQEVLKRVKSWDVFVFPTLFEELSMASIEAMAAGLAVVGWKIDALEAAWGKTGILLPKGNIKLLAKTMAKLITSPSLREKMGFQAWQRAKKYFDWEVVLTKLEKVYFKTIKEKQLSSRS